MSHPFRRLAAVLVALLAFPAGAAAPEPSMADATRFTVATYNASLFDDEAGAVAQRLAGGQDVQARKVAAIVQRVRPDLLLVNELDHDEAGTLADTFQREYLEVGQDGEAPLAYPYRFFAPVNTGVPSGMDLNRDGQVGGEGRKRGEDSFGFGLHPGQYGMLVLSRFPIDVAQARTFQHLPWAALPEARRPRHPDGGWWHDDAVWPKLRLSSKSHWDVPVQTPAGTVHFLASHPTPPVFDGPEDRNGKRNADEIRLWGEYVWNRGNDWIVDDRGQRGGLKNDARFVIAGDLNADPADGDGIPGAITELLENPRVLRMLTPRSEGAAQAAEAAAGANSKHRGSPRHDTGDFGPRVGNLRLDYVLPSVGWQVSGSGVFWPKSGEPGHDWLDATDHRMVWVDLRGD